MPRVAVIGTGTGVGKTYVTCALTRALARASGQTVAALKPIETGCDPDPLDALALGAASTPSHRIPPRFAYRPPISPHLAARRAGDGDEISRLRTWLPPWLSDATLHYIWTVVETAGGALSPVGAGVTSLDVAIATRPDVLILVAPDRLGVLHDVSATLGVLRARLVAEPWLVLSAPETPDDSTGSNAAELSALEIADVAAVVARDGSLDALAARLVQREAALSARR